MSNFDDLSPDELAAARVDSELSDEVAARVDADPALTELVAEQEAVGERLRSFDPPPMPSSAVQESHLSAAMAAFDELHSPAGATDATTATAGTGSDVDVGTDAGPDKTDEAPKLRSVPTDQSATAATGATSATDRRQARGTAPTPPPTSLRDARSGRRRNTGAWILSAAAALLLVVAAVGLISQATNDEDSGDETASASDGSEATDDDGSGDDAASSGEALEEQGGVAASPSEDTTLAADADAEAAATQASDDAAMDEDDSGDGGGDDDGAMEEDDSMAADDDASGDEASSDDASGDEASSDTVADPIGDTPGILAIPLADFFGRDDLRRPDDQPVSCADQAEARFRQWFGDDSVLIDVSDDPVNEAVTVFTFETDAVNPQRLAAIVTVDSDCSPAAELLLAEPTR